jgi:phosphoribosyl 1,2-cyclic phosphodiesterase
MFHVTVLGSGSTGNSALVETAGTRLLLDAGLSARQLKKRLAECGVEPDRLDAIVLTHEHGDHSGGVQVWCKQYGTPVYCSRLTAQILQKEGCDAVRNWRLFQTGADFEIQDIRVRSFPVPHDAVDPAGFVLEHSGARLGLLTDLGAATKLVYERVRGVHTLLVETNHDERLLQEDTRRPWSVKQRIMSRHGHLSNAAAAAVIGEVLADGLQRAVLGHLSRDCNTPELAVGAVRQVLEQNGRESVEVFCAGPSEISPRMLVG